MAPSVDRTPVRAVLRCVGNPSRHWKTLLLDTHVAGRPVLERHLLAFRDAGIAEVTVAVPPTQLSELGAASLRGRAIGLSVTVCSSEARSLQNGPKTPTLVLEQRADTLIDPRLIAEVVRLARSGHHSITCLDRDDGSGDVDAKSPYRVGVPRGDEATVVDAPVAVDMTPIGLTVERPDGGPALNVYVGRYYWHRLDGPQDAASAIRKILHATMKPTDGIFARANRRVSLKISRLLLDTPVTPNMITIAAFCLGLITGYLLAFGRYPQMVAGSFLAWFASMLDGVDGELARAKYQATRFGHWLEMACDYAFYVVLTLGLGSGVAQASSNPVWLVVGAAAAAGALASFVVFFNLMHRYGQHGEPADFNLAFQKTFKARGNPILRAAPHFASLAMRSSLPYYTLLFVALGLAKPLLILICFGSQSIWVVGLCMGRMRIALDPEPTDRLDAAVS